MQNRTYCNRIGQKPSPDLWHRFTTFVSDPHDRCSTLLWQVYRPMFSQQKGNNNSTVVVAKTNHLCIYSAWPILDTCSRSCLYPQQIPQRLAIQHNPAVVLEVAKDKKQKLGFAGKNNHCFRNCKTLGLVNSGFKLDIVAGGRWGRQRRLNSV